MTSQLSCRVTYEIVGENWFWKCVTCATRGEPADILTASEEAIGHQYEVLYAEQVKTREEGLVP